MKIKILGTRGLVKQSKPYHSRHTGILIDDTILVDLGEDEYLEHKPESIIFTHFHPDHAWFVSHNKKFEPGIPIYAPEQHDLVPEVRVIKDKFSVAEYVITPIPVIHSIKVKSLGYVIEKENKKIFISGDVAWIEKQHHDEISGAHLIVTEASFIKKGGQIRRKEDKIFGHTGVPDLVRMFDPLSRRIAFLHYGSWFIKGVEKGKQKIKALQESAELIAAYDGLELTV